MRATVKPDNATDKSVIWTSDNPDVASVNSHYGIIKGVAPGVANITATAADGSGVSCCVKVYVSPKFICVESISIEGVPESAIHEGDKLQLYAIVNPENATDKSVVWTSDSPRVISVDSGGLIIAVGLGVADIMAIAADGSGVYSSVTLCVSPIFVESIQILGLPEGVIEVGDMFRLQAIVYPDNATDKSVRWSSTAQEVAVVDDDGNVEITGIGTAGIVATAQDERARQAVVYIDTVAEVADISADAGPFKVFDIHGRLIRTSDSPDTLRSLPPGVYIVRTPTNTYKITH